VISFLFSFLLRRLDISLLAHTSLRHGVRLDTEFGEAAFLCVGFALCPDSTNSLFSFVTPSCPVSFNSRDGVFLYIYLVANSTVSLPARGRERDC
jgi:hypothetical protein